MKKTDAIKAFGSPKKLAKALGLSRQGLWVWPEDLRQDQADRIRGAAIRLGLEVPEISDDVV